MGAEHRDLSIESVLADPLIRAANKADHVSLQDFERLLRATARDLKTGLPGRRPDAKPASRGLCTDWSACFA
jgi:hypothetical protein